LAYLIGVFTGAQAAAAGQQGALGGADGGQQDVVQEPRHAAGFGSGQRPARGPPPHGGSGWFGARITNAGVKLFRFCCIQHSINFVTGIDCSIAGFRPITDMSNV
jgi:hypothetical protein